MVGSIVDPAVDDGLALSGPGAPGGPFSGGGEHPVKARLAARARLARGEATEEDLRLLGTGSKGSAPEVTTRSTPAGALSTDPTSSLPRTDGASPPTLPARRPTPTEDDEPSEQAADEAPLTRRTSSEPAEFAPSTPPPQSAHSPSPSAVAEELDRIIGRTTTVPEAHVRPALAPNLVALSSALIGLSILFTLGVFLEPNTFDHEGSAQAEASAAPTTTAPPLELAPPVERPQRSKVPGPWRIADDQGKPGHRVISGKVGKVAFLKAIEEAGLPKNEAYRAYGALKETLDLDHCRPKDTFRALVVGREKRLVAFEYEKSKEEVYQAKLSEAGKLVGTKLDLKVERNQIRRAFVHDGKSFDASAVRAGFDEGLAEVAEQAFRGHLGLRELRAGDRLRVIAQEVTVLGEFARYAGIEAIEVVRAGQAPKRVYYFNHPDEGGYFDANGRAPYEGGWRKPITGAPITSRFNMKRMHPVLKKTMPHTGTDYGAPTGTPIGATAPGVVTFIGNGGPSGNLVKVKHDGGYESGYAHLSRFVPGLKVGDSVERMEVVGYCGTTGRSTGPHLHFTMKKNGEYIDPESLNLDGLRVLGTAHRSAFAEVRRKYDEVLDAIALPEVPPALLGTTAPAAADTDASAAGHDDEAHGGMEDPSVLAEQAAPLPPAAPAPAAAAPGAVATPGAPAAAPASAAPPPASAPQAPPVPASKPADGPSAIFLTDADLLKMQGAVHEGEVTQ